MRLAVLADVLEQLLAGQLLAAPDHACQPPIPQPDLVLAAGLAAEPEADRRAGHARVAGLEGRQAERAVEPRVLVVADPDERRLQEPDDRRQDLLARQTRRCKVRRRTAPGSAAARGRSR